MERTETFQINDIASFAELLPRLSEHNPDYDLTTRELMERGLVGQRIYEDLYPCEDVSLVPGTYRTPSYGGENETSHTADAAPGSTRENTGSRNDASESTTPAETGSAAPGDDASPEDQASADPSPASAGAAQCLLVQVSGENVGYIRKANYSLLKDLLDKGAIVSLSLALQGGPYRMLFEDGTEEKGSAGFFGLLTAVIREEEPHRNTESGEARTTQYISTSYDTLLLEQRGRRGTPALILALILSAFYVGFSIPYWIMIRRGMIASSAFLGGDLPDQLLRLHLGPVIAAVVLTLLSLFMKNSVLPVLAALVFTGSSWTLPGYALFTAPCALLCAIAALRRKSKGFLTFLKVLTLLGVLGVSGWLLKDTALYFWNNKTFMIRPTGTEEAPAVSEDEGYDEFTDFDDSGDFYDDYDEEYDGSDEDYGDDTYEEDYGDEFDAGF